MNTYRNKRTGAEVITESTVTGGDWELVKPKKEPKERARSPTPARSPKAARASE